MVLQVPAMPVAPLRPMDRAWLAGWAERLNPRRHPAVAAAALVSAAIAAVPEPAERRRPAFLAAWPAVTGVLVGEPTHESIGPRSMGAHEPALAATAPRTAELLAALSTGLDLAESRPDATALRT